MRPETKLRVSRRKHTVELLRWLYSRRDAKVDGARLSLDHRERQQGGVTDSRSLTYGEVDVPDFLAILDIVKPREGEVFVDLGSGTGKAVLASSCGFPEFSKCLGIELVQGLVEAAAHHLQTAKTFLSKPRPTLPGTASALSNNDNSPLSTKAIAEETGVSPSGAHRDGSHHRRGGGNKRGVGGRGGGGRNGKASSGKAASSRGLSAADLEELIADLLSRQPLGVTGAGTGGDCDDEGFGTARGGREATAEEVASWLVRELGHRRYKDSLRGYGGLQKFLVARRKIIDSGTPSRLKIAEDGSKLTASPPAGVSPPPVAWESLRDEGAASEDADEGGTARCGCIAGQDCANPCRCAEEYGVLTVATGAAAVVSTAAVAAAAAAAPAAASAAIAAAPGSSSVSLASGGSEPSSVSALKSWPVRTSAASTESSAPTSPLSSLSSSRGSPTPTDEVAGPFLATFEGAARTPDGGGGSGRDSRKAGGLNETDRRRFPEEGPLTCESLSGVEMVCGDIFEEDWSDAGVVYVASLLFSDGMMIQLSKAVGRLRQGARVVSLRKIPTLTEGGEIPSQSERGLPAPIKGGEITSQPERSPPPLREDGRVPSRSERGVPALIEDEDNYSQSERGVTAPIEGGEIPSQSELRVPAPIEGGEIPSQSERGVHPLRKGREIPSQSDRGDDGGLQGESGGTPVRQPALRLLHEGVFRMSWQMARVYIYVRT